MDTITKLKSPAKIVVRALLICFEEVGASGQNPLKSTSEENEPQKQNLLTTGKFPHMTHLSPKYFY